MFKLSPICLQVWKMSHQKKPMWSLMIWMWIQPLKKKVWIFYYFKMIIIFYVYFVTYLFLHSVFLVESMAGTGQEKKDDLFVQNSEENISRFSLLFCSFLTLFNLPLHSMYLFHFCTSLFLLYYLGTFSYLFFWKMTISTTYFFPKVSLKYRIKTIFTCP